ncbi:histidinol-phosphate aminotransferase [Actibacterium mucosum KCTC 23349]|uniref:Histidinol-phosphate aminotransferase n=1 Tax=Actibacterium mucosum KCTC 23349 TaxID=1454373 RepID=A0A037ZHT9_9RHOB|nr:histidinol-phosphate transaminase [Actibacterium mucosum]KAJ55112.1 histidinol-phosphate aminotransferase [Actibacterium mucosum KCTC 23349]
MAKSITPQPGILDIALYVGGASKIEGKSDVVKLSSNENPYGPSDQAKEAFARSGLQLHRYPPTDHAHLREAIAEIHDVDADRVICGVGSDEVITFLCQAFAGPGDEVIHTEHGFSMYKISTLAAGATPVEVPERERVVDVDAIVEACNFRTKLVFIANPGNPTGTMIGGNELAQLADRLPPHVLLVVDAAYAEYAEGYDGGKSLVDERDNVFMTRTFSKIYGLGGLRVGWGYGSQDVIDVLNRVRGPFNLSVAQIETAAAALRDLSYTEKCRADNARLRIWLADALAETGVQSDASSANFILARFDTPDEAEACYEWLRDEGILVRKVAGYKLPQCLRITIGDEAACRRVAHVVRAFRERSE